MPRYRITSAGRSYEPRVKHNADAWNRMKALLERRSAVNEDDLRASIRGCKKNGKPNGAFFGYSLKRGWIEEF